MKIRWENKHKQGGPNFRTSFCIYFYKNSWSKSVKRKIELFMILLLLIGAIVASWKLSELTADVSKNQAKKDDRIVIVVDPGHGASQLRQK